MRDELSARQWQEAFRAGAFNAQDRYTQCRAGWYDWFCQDHALAGRLKKIGRVVMGITDPFILDNYFVWFKNNCPLEGSLYDDARFEPLSGERGGKYFVVSLDSPHEREKWALVTERYGFDAPEFDCRNIREMVKYINSIGPELQYLVDLCAGQPQNTEIARCLTARYGQTTLSTHPRERSGVLLVKEATKRGYKEAHPGDTVDLGYAGSNTRRGRVGHDIAHTLETSSIQGVVERGGRIRRLMPRECLRLQGFDEKQIDRLLAITSDAQAYKQAGNSVTVNVIEAIGRRLQEVDEDLRRGAA